MFPSILSTYLYRIAIQNLDVKLFWSVLKSLAMYHQRLTGLPKPVSMVFVDNNAEDTIKHSVMQCFGDKLLLHSHWTVRVEGNDSELCPLITMQL